MNKHLKKILLTVSFLLFLIIPPRRVYAQEDSTTVDESVNIYFFWGVGCPHCEKEKEYLKELKKNYPQVNVLDFEVWNSKENLDLMTQFAKTLDVDVRGVPFTVVGDHHIEGWLSDEYTGRQLEEAVSCALAKGCQDLGKGLITQAVSYTHLIIETELNFFQFLRKDINVESSKINNEIKKHFGKHISLKFKEIWDIDCLLYTSGLCRKNGHSFFFNILS